MFPHLKSQWRGEARSREEREIRDEVSFQASQESMKKPTSLDEPESLPSRICRTLDGVPRNGQLEGGNIKMFWLCPKFVKYLYTPKNRCFLLEPERNGFEASPRFGASYFHVRQ